MARARFAAALAVPLLVLLSAGAARATESEERALREQFADRDEYRAKLILELQRREVLLAQQQDVLSRLEDGLQAMHAKLSQPVSEDEEATGPSAGDPTLKSVNGQKLKPDTVQVRRSKDYETQDYKVMVARYSVAQTKRDIEYLKALLARNP